MSRANQSAFPLGVSMEPGLTVREHFAAMAMQGILASLSNPGATTYPTITAELAVQCADALIAALESPK